MNITIQKFGIMFLKMTKSKDALNWPKMTLKALILFQINAVHSNFAV